MKVVVLKNFRSLGQIGRVVEVKPGYAKNYLVPNGIVAYATRSILSNIDEKKSELVKHDEAVKNDADIVKSKFEGSFVRIIRSASDDGRLYGSVVPRDILEHVAGFISSVKVELPVRRGDVSFDQVKEIGFYDCKVVLHPEVVLSLKINVCRSESEGVVAEKKLLSKESESKKERENHQDSAPKKPIMKKPETNLSEQGNSESVTSLEE